MLSIHQILKTYWGHDTFRPLQEDIINAVLNGNDVLALLPTGGGKSICFQVPAMAKDGICLVVSPLIALMKDQVLNLKRKGIKAEALYTGLRYEEADAVIGNCLYGGVKFLYVSPERLSSESFQNFIKQLKINLLAVDEAHCISQWGYDFRPAYLKIAEIRDVLPNVPLIALTATATEKVATDIVEKLRFRQNLILRKSFQRTNLSYVVRNTVDKQAQLLHILKSVPGTSVVYTRNRKSTKLIADFLKSNKINASFYHAGLSTDERSIIQDAWIKNKTRVIVCTNAFGMGIDKPDVRTVIHMDVPESLEAYFQEAGRAGRDEQKAYVVLLVDKHDKRSLQQRADNFPTVTDLQHTYEQLCNFLELPLHQSNKAGFDFDVARFVQYSGRNTELVLRCINLLQQLDVLSVTDSVFQRPKIKCIVSKETLFDFQSRYKLLEPLVKLLLRTCEGIFDDFVTINQQEIANRLRLSNAELVEQLIQLHKHQIFSYVPLVDQPQITFTHERVNAKYLNLQPELIEFRNKQNIDRLNAMMNYINTHHVCRSVVLVSYFGEHHASPCGICDVCVAERKSGLSATSFVEISQAIEAKLATPQSIESIIANINFPRENVIALLQHLAESELVSKTSDNSYVWAV